MWSYALRRGAWSGDYTITKAGGAVTYNSVIVSRRTNCWRGSSVRRHGLDYRFNVSLLTGGACEVAH